MANKLLRPKIGDENPLEKDILLHKENRARNEPKQHAIKAIDGLEEVIQDFENRVKTLEDNPPPTIDIDDQVTEASPNAVKSSGIWAALQALWESVTQAISSISIPTKTSELNNDSGFITAPTVETFSEAFNVSASDSNKIKRCTSATDLNVTIPADLILAQPFAIDQAGNGVAEIVGDGATIVGNPKTAGQNSMIVIVQVGVNTFRVIGGTS